MEISASAVAYSESEGCLYFDSSKCLVKYRNPKIFKISRWDDALQCFVQKSKKSPEKWERNTPSDLVLISPKRKNIKGRDINNFFSSVPIEVQNVASKYIYHQIPVLRFLRHEGALELANHSPVIAWLFRTSYFRN